MAGHRARSGAWPPPTASETVAAYACDGAVLIRGLFTPFLEQLRVGVERNLAEPGPHAAENLKPGDTGRFFDDYCNWTRIPEFAAVVTDPDIARVAAALMRSQTVQLFHDHVLVKEPGTSAATPWHQDSPYYFVEGQQNLSFWVPLDPVSDATLRCVAGSHLWDRPVLPTRWVSEQSFYPDAERYRPVPDPDADGMRILEWPMEPGDAIAFHFSTLHGARGNVGAFRRRAFSVRYLGDDARFVERPGRTSPPFPGHGMVNGQRLREDWFPRVPIS